MRYLLILLTTFILFSCSEEEIKPKAEKPFMASFDIGGNAHISPGSQMKASVESNDLIFIKVFEEDAFKTMGIWLGDATITPIELTHGKSYKYEICVIKDADKWKHNSVLWKVDRLDASYFTINNTSSVNMWYAPGSGIEPFDPFGRLGGSSDYHRGYEVFASIETKTADVDNPTISLEPRRYNTKLNISMYNLRSLSQGHVRARILQRSNKNGVAIQDFYYLDHDFAYPNNYYQQIITPINLRNVIEGAYDMCEIRLENFYTGGKRVINSPDGTSYWSFDRTFSGVYDFCCDNLHQTQYTLTLEPSIVDCYECDDASGQIRTKVPKSGTDYIATINQSFNEYFCFIGKNGYVVKDVNVTAKGSTNVGLAVANQPWIDGKRAKIWRVSLSAFANNYFDDDFIRFTITAQHETTGEEKIIYKYLRFKPTPIPISDILIRSNYITQGSNYHKEVDYEVRGNEIWINETLNGSMVLQDGIYLGVKNNAHDLSDVKFELIGSPEHVNSFIPSGFYEWSSPYHPDKINSMYFGFNINHPSTNVNSTFKVRAYDGKRLDVTLVIYHDISN